MGKLKHFFSKIELSEDMKLNVKLFLLFLFLFFMVLNMFYPNSSGTPPEDRFWDHW